MTDPPHIAFPAIALDAITAELQRELAQRRRTYPEQIRKGDMTEAESARQLALATAWLEDVARIRDWRAGAAERWHRFTHGLRPSSSGAAGARKIDGMEPAPATHGLAWADRRAALLRELELRRRFYPQLLAKGDLLPADATRQADCLRALLALYEDGWDWTATNGARPNFGKFQPSIEERLAGEEYCSMRLAVARRDANAADQHHFTQALAVYGIAPQPTRQQELAV